MGSNERSLPSLAVTRDEARARLAEQIKQGDELSERNVQSEKCLEQLKPDRGQWFSFTTELLRRIFTTDEVMESFTPRVGVSVIRDVRRPPPLGERASKEKKDISGFVARLTAIQSKVALYPEPAGADQKRSEPSADPKSVFIVHGHDDGKKEAVARFVERLKLQAVILHEQPNRGRTIIEKFEANSAVRYAIVLLTSDDKGGVAAANPSELQPRARQNVVFELGYFFAALGRENVCALYADGVEQPSDIDGLLYISLESTDWKIKLAREMKAAGLEVDMNLAV